MEASRPQNGGPSGVLIKNASLFKPLLILCRSIYLISKTIDLNCYKWYKIKCSKIRIRINIWASLCIMSFKILEIFMKHSSLLKCNVMTSSGILSLLLTNKFYQTYLKPIMSNSPTPPTFLVTFPNCSVLSLLLFLIQFYYEKNNMYLLQT